MAVALDRQTIPSRAAAPSSPVGGELYYNSGDGNLYVYDAVAAAWDAHVTTNTTQTISGAKTFSTDLTAQTAVTIPTGFVSSFIALDTTAMAANVGGSIEFRGKYTAAGGLADYAAISGVKANATDGNIDGLLRFFVRANASALVERANLDTSGNLSVTGQYRIGGTQISASNLSNGVTGSGAVVLAASPTMSGTITFTGTINDSFGTLISLGAGKDNWGNLRVIRSQATNNDGMYIGYGGTAAGAGTAPLRFFVDGSTAGNGQMTLTNTGLSIASGTTYQINGVQIAAANLSNGVTGSGAVVLATSPTIAGFLTFNGTLRGQASGSGAIQLQPGTSTNPGYVEWVNSSGTRMGYMGFDTTHLTLMIEQAGTFQVGRGTAVTRSADTPLFSVLWPNSQTYSANLASTEGSYFAQPTYAGDVAGRTITSAGTVVIQGAPVASGTNLTITNAYALLVQAGAAVFAGNASVGGSGQAVGFFGATPGAKRVSYGSGTQIGTYTTLSSTSTLNDVIAAVTKIIADLRDGYGLVGA